jgi:hypothetical protein
MIREGKHVAFVKDGVEYFEGDRIRCERSISGPVTDGWGRDLPGGGTWTDRQVDEGVIRFFPERGEYRFVSDRYGSAGGSGNLFSHDRVTLISRGDS